MRVHRRWFHDRPKTRYDYLRAHLPMGVRLLNIGNVGAESRSSHARLVEEFPRSGGFLVGCDLDREASVAAHFPLQVTGSVERLPFRDSSFDAAYMGEVIEHVWDPLHALEEVRRVLRPEGLLILDTPNAMSLSRLVNWWARHLDDVGDPDHKILFTPATLARLLHDAGFAVSDMATDQKIRLGPISASWLPGAPRLGPHLLLAATRTD